MHPSYLVKLISLTTLFITITGCLESSGNDDKESNNSANIESVYHGQWVPLFNSNSYAASARSLYLDEQSLGQVIPKPGDPNIITFTPSGQSHQYEYFRAWSEGRTTQIKGSIQELSPTSSQSLPTSSARSLSTRSIADIDVVLINLANGQTETTSTNSDGNFEISDVEPGDYELNAEDGSGGVIDATINAKPSPTNIGNYTLVDAQEYNFKSSFVATENNGYSFEHHQPFLFADLTSYRGQIEIANIGTSLVEGAYVSINFNHPTIYSVELDDGADRGDGQWEAIINSVAPDSSAMLSISNLRFNPINSNETTVEIPITISDSRGNSWDDHLQLKLYKRRLNINIRGDRSGNLYGKFVFPDSSVVHFNKGLNFETYYDELPYLAGQSYQFVFFTDNDEMVYSVGLNQHPPETADFTNTGASEPDDLPEQSTLVTAGEQITSYLSAVDYDYITVDMPESLPIGELTFSEIGLLNRFVTPNNGDNNFNPGESHEFEFAISNTTANRISINRIDLATTDPYLTLTSSSIIRDIDLLEHSVTDSMGYLSTNQYYLTRRAVPHFALDVSNTAPDNHVAEITATLYTDTGSDFEIIIPIMIQAE